MLAGLRRHWEELRDAPSGHRFETLFRQRSERRTQAWLRPLMMVLGLVVVLVGAVMMPAPGPGAPIVLAGLYLLARESLAISRLLDRTERGLQRLPWLRGRLGDGGNAETTRS